MATSYSFDANTLVTPTYLTLSQLIPGPGPGVNSPSQFSSVAAAQAIEVAGDVDVFAVTLVAGTRYTLDIDGGAGDASGGSVDLELELIDHRGLLVGVSDRSAGTDNGSASPLDPLLAFTANRTGTYFVAVHAQNDEYINGFFGFETPGGGTGDYSLAVSALNLPPIATLTARDDRLTLGDVRNNIQALAGDDVISANGGNDIVQGGLGSDRLFGGAGDDELAGSVGLDELRGGVGSDVLVGGPDRDVLGGGAGNDALNGGIGTDILGGADGNDTLWGEAGGDRLDGGSGNDFLRGGAGGDTLAGGAGNDTFHFLRGESPFAIDPAGEDRILDFQVVDTIDLTDVRLGPLAFRGEAAFTGANQVRVADLRGPSGNGFQEVRVNLDSNTATVELAILVDTTLLSGGSFTLGASDFDLS